MQWIETHGIVKFAPKNKTRKHDKQSSWKSSVIIEINDDLSEYYAWFILKRYNLRLNKPLRGSHFTIVNDKTSDISNWDKAKELYHNKKVRVYYCNVPVSNGEHWWLKSFSFEGENLRTLMGLDQPYFGYHITIGLAAHLQLDHSNYILECDKFHNGNIRIPNYKEFHNI